MLVGASAFPDLGPIDVGKARRTGQAFTAAPDAQHLPQTGTPQPNAAQANGNGVTTSSALASQDVSGNGATPSMETANTVRLLQLTRVAKVASLWQKPAEYHNFISLLT